MSYQSFAAVAARPSHPRWEALITRETPLYERADEVRSPFARDYTRILHSSAYRRLKHKTQVFYNIDNDHICTRMEHVAHVESVSCSIARHLGLNDELTKAIAIGHDLGHAPFGHHGETVISFLSKKYLGKSFWHEKNGLHFVDDVELLEDNYRVRRNLDLTYAVRDGIISHCGEIEENGLIPRRDLIPLSDFQEPSQYQPATWEGCVVKLSDKIAYIGRDIEDALHLGFLDSTAQDMLVEMARANDENALNTTVIMHNLIIDVCENSSPEKGICLSARFLKQMNDIRGFNRKYIYGHRRLVPFERYSDLVITQLFEILSDTYDGRHSWENLEAGRRFCPILMSSFLKWLAKYCDPSIVPEGELRRKALACKNKKIYEFLQTREIYTKAILDYISGMTDRFAVRAFQELLTY